MREKHLFWGMGVGRELPHLGDWEKLSRGLFKLEPKAQWEFSKGGEIAPWAEGQCPQNLSRGRSWAGWGTPSPKSLRKRGALLPGHTGYCRSGENSLLVE